MTTPAAQSPRPADLPDLAVTGSTGRLGGRVARLLADAGLEQRLLVRDVARAPDLPGTVAVPASYGERDLSTAALAGVRTLFMVSATEDPARVQQHRSFVDAAAAAGVQHVVYTSFAGAAADAVFTLGREHWATEEHLRASGLAWTFLRDSLYLDFLPLLAGDDGVIRGPAADGRVAAVAHDDVAAVAATVLRDVVAVPGSHAGATYTLTGPEAVDLAEAAAAITAGTGRDVSYEPETVEQAYASRASTGAPDWQLDAWVSSYTSMASGEMAAVTGDVPRLLGRPAISLQRLLGGDPAQGRH